MTTSFFIKRDNINAEPGSKAMKKTLPRNPGAAHSTDSRLRTETELRNRSNSAGLAFAKSINLAGVPLMKMFWSGKDLKSAISTLYRTGAECRWNTSMRGRRERRRMRNRNIRYREIDAALILRFGSPSDQPARKIGVAHSCGAQRNTQLF
jgi:hypothetical protein